MGNARHFSYVVWINWLTTLDTFTKFIFASFLQEHWEILAFFFCKYILLVCLIVNLFVSNKRQNSQIDRAQHVLHMTPKI